MLFNKDIRSNSLKSYGCIVAQEMNKTIRVFCTKPSGIVLRKLMEDLQEEELDVRMMDSSLELDIETPTWEKTTFACGDGSPPFTIEHYISGMQDKKIEDETKRFLEMLEETEESWGKREVLVYIKMTRELFVIRSKGDVGKQTSEVINYCGELFTLLGEGIVQIDGEGFRKKGKLILPFAKF